jgi:5-methylcytosine-specific restriction endonuclease McrA
MPALGSTTSRGYGATWRALRTEAKQIYPSICHLCHLDIDQTLHAKHPQSWTLDHLDPLADGVHLPTLDRVRPAHKGCNSRRGAGGIVSPRSRDW